MTAETVTEPLALDALAPDGAYHAHNRLTIDDLAGVPTAELSLVPKVFVTRAMAALRTATSLPVAERTAALKRAGLIFAEEVVGGLSYAEYLYTVSRVSGVPIGVARSAARNIILASSQAAASADQARPSGAVMNWHDPGTQAGQGVWTRRGDVFAVHAAGNHPAPHALWLEALALGFRVAVRPSRREPFTPHRLVSALRQAGFGDDQVVLLPTEYEAADEMLRCADLGLVYGGEDIVAKYAGDPTVLTQGPGRSKILLTAEVDWQDHLDSIVDSISGQGGVSCLNTTAVFVEGDPAPLAEALAGRLATLPSLPPEDEDAVLPVQPLEVARKLEKYLLAQAAGTTAWLGGDGIVAELGDGSAVLRPAVHQLDRPDAAQAGLELPFPCVWVAPWSVEAGIAPLKDTLVLTAVTQDDGLVDRLVNEPTIGNVYLGDHPTHWVRPGTPHDGYLGDFLMRSKTVIRD
jgi:acyl-CoA reductase-like NAD-dependent aldehyde dehydrogenase